MIICLQYNLIYKKCIVKPKNNYINKNKIEEAYNIIIFAGNLYIGTTNIIIIIDIKTYLYNNYKNRVSNHNYFIIQ